MKIESTATRLVLYENYILHLYRYYNHLHIRVLNGGIHDDENEKVWGQDLSCSDRMKFTVTTNRG